MPVKIKSNLPAREILENENIFVMDETRSAHQDIRPIEIGILNLMPLKEDNELQTLRSLSNTPLQVNVTFMTVSSHESAHTSQKHLNQFYVTLDDIRDRNLDGLIITGAPVEQMDFEEVDYWDEVCEIMDWDPDYRYKVLGKMVQANGKSLIAFDLTSSECFPKVVNRDGKKISSRQSIFAEQWSGKFGPTYSESRRSLEVKTFDNYTVITVNGKKTEVHPQARSQQQESMGDPL